MVTVTVAVTAIAPAGTAPPVTTTLRVPDEPIGVEARVSRTRRGVMGVTPLPVGNHPVTSTRTCVLPL